jgi:hypothetical protein
MLVAGWFALITLPLGAITLVLATAVLIVQALRRGWKARSAAEPRKPGLSARAAPTAPSRSSVPFDRAPRS